MHCRDKPKSCATASFKSNTKNKVKHRKCHSDENKKSHEEHVALQLYLQSLNIMTKYWVEIYSLTNVYIGEMYGSNILYLNLDIEHGP